MKEYLVPLVERLTEIVEAEMQMDPAHDLNHLHRVCNMGLKLLDEKFETSILEAPVYMEVAVICASYLHDIVNTPKNEEQPKGDHNDAHKSAVRAKYILYDRSLMQEDITLIGYMDHNDDQFVRWIFDAIREHSFTSNMKASSFISEALQDADRLDALGAVGISRIMANSVALGQKIYHPTDPFATNREIDPTYLFDTWWKTRGMHYHSTFNTPLGKRLGRERTLETLQFFVKFGEEIGHPVPLDWYPKF